MKLLASVSSSEKQSRNITHFNIPLLEKYYPHEMGVLKFHGIDKLMVIQQDYSEDLIKEFFATVYFSDEIRKTMTWMSAGQQCSMTIKECAVVWKIPMPFPGDSDYMHIHDETIGTLPYTPYLDMAYPPGGIDAPNISSMTPRYQLYNKVLRNTIAIKAGDRGVVRGWLINTLYYLEKEKKIDLLDYIYQEIRICVLERKCCILAPYIQQIIEHCIGITLANSYQRTKHKVQAVQAPKVLPPPPQPDARYAPDNQFKAMMKKIFCMQVDTHKQNYKTHVANKKIRQNQKQIMRHQGLTVVSGSEDVITDEATWLSRHSSTWEFDDASSSHVPRDDEDAPGA
jgi:hypothetical protein